MSTHKNTSTANTAGNRQSKKRKAKNDFDQKKKKKNSMIIRPTQRQALFLFVFRFAGYVFCRDHSRAIKSKIKLHRNRCHQSYPFFVVVESLRFLKWAKLNCFGPKNKRLLICDRTSNMCQRYLGPSRVVFFRAFLYHNSDTVSRISTYTIQRAIFHRLYEHDT